MKKHNLLVIIVAYNSMKWVEKCYGSLRTSSTPCDIITIDNGSTDGTQEFIKTHFPEVQLIENKQNLGFGRANNIGLQKVLDEGYDYAYLLNQDAWILPDTFKKLIEISKKHPEYGILSPMQLKADLQHLDGKFATHVIGESHKKPPLFIDDCYFGRQEDVYEVSFVMAAHWLITKKCIESTGGFSPTFFMYGEDDNYLNRTNYWNLKIGIVPSSKAVHDRGDANWSEEKDIFIKYYSMSLDLCSNPCSKKSIWTFIKCNIKASIKTHNRLIWNYAIRLFKERHQIEANYRTSLQKCAFLTPNKK